MCEACNDMLLPCVFLALEGTWTLLLHRQLGFAQFFCGNRLCRARTQFQYGHIPVNKVLCKAGIASETQHLNLKPFMVLRPAYGSEHGDEEAWCFLRVLSNSRLLLWGREVLSPSWSQMIAQLLNLSSKGPKWPEIEALSWQSFKC